MFLSRLRVTPAALGLSMFLTTGLPLIVAADAAWHRLESDRFTIVSQFSESETREWAREFSLFIDEVTGFLRIQKDALRPVTVVLFDRKTDFLPYRPVRSDGQRANISGIFASGETWSVIGMARRASADSTRRIILHEGFHWIASSDPQFYPLWVSEGLAEVFSTFEVGRRGIEWGGQIASHVRTLRDQPLIPLADHLRITPSDLLFEKSDHTGIFYAQSWALAHYLMFGKRKDPRHSLDAYLWAVRSGRLVEAALTEVLGVTEHELERNLHRHLARERSRRQTRQVSQNSGRDFDLVQASEAEVEASLGRLALGTNNFELARAHASRAVEFDPQRPQGHEVLAWLAEIQGREGEVGGHAERAIRCGSADAWMYLLLATAFQRSQEAGIASAGGVARTVANLLEQGIDQNPRLAQLYELLAAQMADAEPLRSSDRQSLEQGRRLFPDNGRILVGLALIAERENNKRELARLLQATEVPEVSLPGWAWKVRERLRRTYIVDDVEPKVRALLEDAKVDEALALYDTAIEATADFRLRQQLEASRRALLVGLRMKAARAMAEAGRYDRARAHYESILAMPDITQAEQAAAKRGVRTVSRRRWDQPGATALP